MFCDLYTSTRIVGRYRRKLLGGAILNVVKKFCQGHREGRFAFCNTKEINPMRLRQRCHPWPGPSRERNALEQRRDRCQCPGRIRALSDPSLDAGEFGERFSAIAVGLAMAPPTHQAPGDKDEPDGGEGAPAPGLRHKTDRWRRHNVRELLEGGPNRWIQRWWRIGHR